MDNRLHPPRSIGIFQISSWDPIAGDASGRQYWRVAVAGAGAAILCRYPESMRSLVRRDIEVLIWLRQQGLPVPQVLASDAGSQWILLEDLGTVDGEKNLRGTSPSSRVARAVTFLEPLVRLSALSVQQLPQWNPQFDDALLRWELSGFEMWSLPNTFNPSTNSPVSKWLDDLATTVAAHPRAICLRDYHLNNILLDAEGNVGIIDVQDLRPGPDTYDLASLLGDRAMPELLSIGERMAVARAWADAATSVSGWERRLEETILQRSLKVLGTFAFLQLQGMYHYQQWVPKTASTAAEIAQNLGAPADVIEILLDLASTGGIDVW